MLPPTQKRSFDDMHESPSRSESAGRAYPRKRVAVACETCRTRKTRCDAARPSCSFCRENGIPCKYTGPSDDDRKPVHETEYTQTLRYLNNIQATLDSVAAAVGATSVDVPGAGFSASQNGHARQKSCQHSITKFARKPIPRMPNLLTFTACSKSDGPDVWTYDCTKDFFRDQLEVEVRLAHAENIAPSNVNLSKPHLWRLQVSFVDGFLKWLPLFNHSMVSHYLQNTSIDKVEYDGPATARVLLIYANGALSRDERRYVDEPSEIPGFDYYARASRVLRCGARSCDDLCTMQCNLMMSIYMLLALRPLESLKLLRKVSQSCILMLKAQSLDQNNEFTESFKRIYWICYVLESELEVCLDLSASGLRLYEDIVSMPNSDYEEDGVYSLLAFSSLRRLMCNVVDSVGLRQNMNAIYAPVVTMELHNQIDHWWQHLPTSLKFPLDGSTLYDMRKAFLRCIFYGLRFVAFWPFVARCKDIRHDGTFELDQQNAADEEYIAMQRGANECLDAARTYIKIAEEIISQWVIDSHVIIRSYHAALMILLLVHPDLQRPVSSTTTDTEVIQHGLINLGQWTEVPFMRRPLQEINRIARLKGIIEYSRQEDRHRDSHSVRS